MLLQGHLKDKIHFLNISKEDVWRVLISNLFNSIIIDRKKNNSDLQITGLGPILVFNVFVVRIH